jgi:hypothetical protein
MDEHKHALIIIKNDKDEYLQYFDNNWDSYLFLNCKFETLNENDIINEISDKLDINKMNINLKLLMDKVHIKFSVSNKKEKKYHHYFYEIDIKDMPNYMLQNEFKKDNINFKWFSILELENDEKIQKVNKDIVEYVKSLNL